MPVDDRGRTPVQPSKAGRPRLSAGALRLLRRIAAAHAAGRYFPGPRAEPRALAALARRALIARHPARAELVCASPHGIRLLEEQDGDRGLA